MEILRGKHASFVDGSALARYIAAYEAVHIDIGTGDGRFVQHVGRNCPNSFVIGIDACRENLVEAVRRSPDNALFVIANALALPPELYSAATHISINFPWGSLLEGLVEGNPALIDGLVALTRSGAQLEIRLNGGALAEIGCDLEEGADRVRQVLTANGFRIRKSTVLTARELKCFPTTWAKRLAYGRDPRAIYLSGMT